MSLGFIFVQSTFFHTETSRFLEKLFYVNKIIILRFRSMFCEYERRVLAHLLCTYLEALLNFTGRGKSILNEGAYSPHVTDSDSNMIIMYALNFFIDEIS